MAVTPGVPPSVSSDLKNASKQRPVAQTDPRPRPIRSKIRYRKLSQFWGDVIAALRITLIANAFPEAEIDRLFAAVSSGFARGKGKARRPKEGRRGQPPDGWSGALRGQGGSGGHLDPQPAHDQKLK
jgi:hypothetical protein